jgi:hypothetical protein
MILIKKVDVEAHFAEKRRLRRASAGLATRPAAKCSSAFEAAGTKVNVSGFRDDSSTEHSFRNGPATPAK